MSTRFDELDAAILAHIREQQGPHPTNTASLLDLANVLDLRGQVPSSPWPGPEGWRLIDRRLQSLRKRGIIAVDRKSPTGWAEA